MLGEWIGKTGVLRHWQYLKYVVRHKVFVLLEGLKIGPGRWYLWPAWLLILLVHDWDKFTPSSWSAYARTFYGPDGSKQYEPGEGFSVAWLHHQHINKHHWQRWIIVWDHGRHDYLPMPDIYRREMLADWRGAGRALGKTDTAEWYKANRDGIRLETSTRKWVEDQLGLQFVDAGPIFTLTHPEEFRVWRKGMWDLWRRN
jgi:hypothetical protein